MGIRPDDEVIHAHTRADALRDGALVDVTEPAREAGFKVPVALTRAVYEDCVRWTDKDSERKGVLQDEEGRMRDLLVAAKRSAAHASPALGWIGFHFERVPVEGGGSCPRVVHLKVATGSGDEGEPVVTIMQFNED